MNTEQIGLLNITTQFLADLWSRFFAPSPFDRIIETNGRRVRVTVADAHDGDTQPLHRHETDYESQAAEQSVDG